MITSLELFNYAATLSEQNSEIEWRDSVKQSYYAVYHCLQEFIKQHNIDKMLKTSGEHQFAIDKLKTIDKKLAHSLARDIKILKDKRVVACYFLDEKLTKLQAKQQFRECQKAIDKLKKLEAELQQ